METLINFVDFNAINLLPCMTALMVGVVAAGPFWLFCSLVRTVESWFWKNRFHMDTFEVWESVAELPTAEEKEAAKIEAAADLTDWLVKAALEEIACKTAPCGVIPAHMNHWPVQPCNNNLLLWPGERLMGEGCEPPIRKAA